MTSKTFQPSPQQAAFLKAVSTPGPSIVLEAVAGAGKTTTLVEAMRVMQGDIAFMAFNTKIVKEIEAKARERGVFEPMRHYIATVHSAGFKAIRSRVSRVRVDENKSFSILRGMVSADDKNALKIARIADRLVGLAKQALLPSIKEAQPSWAALARKYSLDDGMPAGLTMRALVVLAQRALIQGNALRDEVIDFDDMVYLPAVFDDYNIRQFDFVLLDEAQDTNAARRELARRMLKPGGRICAVGDRYQALYAFTGADTESLDRIMEEFDAVSMPLSVSYRCPKSVVVEAQKHVPHIQAHPSAPDGDVQHLTISRDTDITNVFGSKDAIICRYNAPIIRLACRLIQAGVSCRVEGRDIGRMMSDLLRKACPDEDAGSEQMREGMASWLQDQMQQAAKRASDSAARIAQDKYDTVLALIDRAEITHGRKATRADVVSVIEALFADDVKDRLVLSTIHKAKGREWPYVFWLQTSERQSHKPPQEWEVQTEICCKYVAITRAQKTLIYLSDTSHD